MNPVLTSNGINLLPIEADAFTPVKGNPLAGSSFEFLPKNITSCIQNFITSKETATRVHVVNSEFQKIWGNDGHLDLSHSNVDVPILKRIISDYKKCGKLISLNLSNCKNITDEALVFLAEIPLKHLN